MQPCEQKNTINKLSDDCEEVRLNESKLAMALERMEEKIDEVLEVVKDQGTRLVKLEKVWLSLKWCSIGVGITIVINAVGIIEFIQGLF